MKQTIGFTTAFAAAAIGLPLASAQAQEYCVACAEPNALYRCVIENAKPGGGQSLQMFCITSMAKDGKHASCAIKRGTVFECDGPIKRIQGSAQSTAVEPQTKQAAEPWGAQTDPNPKEPPPKTLVDMAKKSNEQNAEQMKKATDNVKDGVQSTGNAIGKATKKSWNCVTSLFKEC